MDMAAPQIRVEVRDLDKVFRLGGTVLEAVKGVSFSIAKGEFVALLGPSGSGKSTVLNMIATLVKPSDGEILIDGARVMPQKAMRQVGYVFQKDTLFPWRTVADNIGYGLELAGVPKAERAERVRMCIAQAGLAGFADAYPSSLSGGMRQRAALMRTLVVEPQILLMDEPFGALDIGLRRRLQDLSRREVEQSGQAVLFVTHDIAEALRLASRIVVLSQRPSRVVADLANTPLTDPARIFEAAAALLRRPEIEAALFAQTSSSGADEIEARQSSGVE